ncbi:EsaB/YukD family protein [Georgenia phoenicis]|uniref:EsaB/YukD family protein n=1 Tax=unclassified Georgenia TaxID=2626815 RepID=UPI0039AEEE9D
MSDYTRLTLVGTTHRADVVVPSTEELGAMLPELLELLREEPQDLPQTVALVRVTGEQVALDADAVTQRLRDGEVLRLVRSADAPPPPQVADVTDATADRLGERADRWTVRTRQAVTAVVVGLAVAVAGLLLAGVPLLDPTPQGAVGLPAVGAAAAVAALASAALGRAGRRYAGTVLLAVGLGLVPALVVSAGTLFTGEVTLRLGVLAAWVVLGAGLGIGRSSRGALTGATAGIVLTVLATALDVLLPATEADAVVAAVTAFLAGLLPWYAMASSGLTALDDQALDGAPPAAGRVRDTLEDSYRSLTWSTVAVALTAAWATSGLLTSGQGIAAVLGLLVVAVLALRSRSLPLRWQVVAMWAGVAVPLVVALAGPVAAHDTLLAAAVAAAVAAVVAVAGALEPSGRQQARLRRLGDLAELLAVLGVLPLLLGVLGVYGRLLETF